MPRRDKTDLLHGSLDPIVLRTCWITAKWQLSPMGRRARYYAITRSGLEQLGRETNEFERFVDAMRRVLRAR